jgi:membrane protease YdiL (CAAX protease family)
MRTGSLGAPIVAHMVNNGPAAVALLIGIPEVTP